MSKRGPDQDWREHVLQQILPRMEAANLPEPAASLPAATPADFAPVTYYSDRTPDDPSLLLDGQPLVKMAALKQRTLDLHGAIPSWDDVQQVRLSKLSHANRVSDLVKLRSEGGYGLPESAHQVSTERKKLERAEQELARLETLREVRSSRWNAAGQIERNVADWLLRGGIPGNCVLEAVEDQPLSELMVKADAGRIDAAIERYRHRLRELAADAHRVRSSPWPLSLAKAAARELVDQFANRGQPNLDGAVEHNLPISFASMTVRSIVHNAQPGAVAYAETPDVLGLIAWMFHDELVAKISAGLDEIADDTAALSQAQREEMEAQISADMLMTERSECACIWAAEAKGEILDFRPDTTPMAALGVALRTVPPAPDGQSTSILAYDVVRGGGR